MEKPDFVIHYEQLISSGEPIYLDPIEVDDLFHYYAEDDEIDKMIPLIQLAKQLHPDNESIISMEAELALNQNQFDRCLSLLEPIYDPNQAFHHVLRSACAAGTHDLPKAMAEAQEAILCAENEETQMRAFVAYDVALGLMNGGYPQEALPYYMQSRSLLPDDLRNLQALSSCALKAGNLDLALDVANHYLELDPYSVEVWLTKGSALGMMERHTEALDAYDYALAIAPESLDVRLSSATSLLALERYDEAESVLRDLLSQDDSSDAMLSDCYHLLGLVLLRYHKDDSDMRLQAIDCIMRSVDVNPTDYRTIARAAFSFYDIGAYSEAISTFQLALTLQHDDIQLLGGFADACAMAERYDEAIGAYSRMVELEPTEEHLLKLAFANLSYAQYNRAYPILQRLIELNDSWQTYVMLAICAHALQWEDDFLRYFTIAYDRTINGTRDMIRTLNEDMDRDFEQSGLYRRLDEARAERIAYQEAVYRRKNSSSTD